MNKYWGRRVGSPLEIIADLCDWARMQSFFFFFHLSMGILEGGDDVLPCQAAPQEEQFSTDSERVTSENNSSALSTSVCPHRGCGGMNIPKPHAW